MDNERLIAQISQREDASVDKVASRKIKSSPMIARMQRADELRKKTVKIEGLNKSRFFKLKIQENFDRIQNTLQFEYGENMEIFFKNNDFEILSRWVEGVTLFDANKKETPQKITDVNRLKNRLRMWVRIFENLSFYHSKGIIHGNLKPQNILIRDRATIDIKQTYESEFFERKEEVPHIVLLDGGYFHLIPHNHIDENNEEKISLSKKIIEKNFWIAPEARGFIEGNFKEESDIFSLAAIMAWDLGMIKLEGQSVLNSLWQLFILPEPNSLILGGEWVKWTNRHPLFESIKRVRTILTRSLHPIPEKRSSKAREIAFEFMMISNKLSESPENQNISSLFSNFQPEFKDKHFTNILNKSFDIPEVLCDYIFDKSKIENNRLWIDALTNSANKHQLMRSLNLGISSINKFSFYHIVKFSSIKVPFSTLNSMCESLLNHTIFLNPIFLQEIKSFFYNLGNQIETLFYVLPSLKKYSEDKEIQKKKFQNTLIQIRHEWINSNIEKIFEIILSSSKISFIIIDDINRCDHSSLPIILNIIKKHSSSIKWIIGTRSEEEIENEESKKLMHLLKHQDIVFTNLREDKTRFQWVTKLNNLESQQARFLSTWAMVDLQINTDIIELLSSKVPAIQEIFSEKYHEGKENIINLNEEAEDLIKFDDTPIQENAPISEEDEDEDKKKKDPLHMAYEALNVAIKIGLVSENRDILTGHLICYYWENQFIWLSLSLLLNKETKAKIYYILSGYMCNSIGEKNTLSEIIHISEYLSRSNLKQCAYSAYTALIIATEELCDNTSAEFIISKLQMLSENIEKECQEEAPLLVPKIREHIADLSLSLGKIEQAEKYYQAVNWNTQDLKRKAILSMKSFFPSQIRKREKRTAEFIKLTELGMQSGILSKVNYESKISYKNEIENEIYKIQKKLAEQDSFSSEEESKNTQLLLKNIINIENNNTDKSDRTQFFPKMKPVRGSVISRFLRTCIGWIDNNILFPHILNVLRFTIENNDGESTIHLLFSLLLCGERNISHKDRALILETILDLSGRVSSDLSIFEAYLLKAWNALFYDGNFVECKKNIDKINSSVSGDLPTSIKQCAKKIQMFVEFENLSFDAVKNHSSHIQKYLKRMSDYKLTNWSIGYAIFSLQPIQAHLKKTVGDELFIGNILDEKTDQILLYTHFLFEKGHAHAASIISQEAKDNEIRQWFADPSSHIEYVPEKFSQKILEYESLRNSIFGSPQKTGNTKFVASIKTFAKVLSKKKHDALKYWGEDKAIVYNIRIDKASTQDSEKLHTLAQNAVRAGFHWTAYRLAHKARADLDIIINEIRDIESSFKITNPKEAAKMLTTHQVESIPQSTLSERVARNYENVDFNPEQGIAINYVLEFLHNFQNNIQNSEISDEERIILSMMIKKSVPRESDIVESTLAGALRAFSKRLTLKMNSSKNEPPQQAETNKVDEENKAQSDQTELKRTG
ncbi:serine/threonine-protein kinase [Silvanigrella aquatica]|uniref:Protein kinase domain-containing protein n=1 Tax=Silvanigrella aquatica TaxID=1915309 RepID=A0A1L4CYS1_9BACT|nr:serine/threonine-protein kinase [Silvanigrella aquatica]APJ03101.1 hypothetical protein AXG55_03935 [Silvanigrella aquatica]